MELNITLIFLSIFVKVKLSYLHLSTSVSFEQFNDVLFVVGGSDGQSVESNVISQARVNSSLQEFLANLNMAEFSSVVQSSVPAVVLNVRADLQLNQIANNFNVTPRSHNLATLLQLLHRIQNVPEGSLVQSRAARSGLQLVYVDVTLGDELADRTD